MEILKWKMKELSRLVTAQGVTSWLVTAHRVTEREIDVIGITLQVTQTKRLEKQLEGTICKNCSALIYA